MTVDRAWNDGEVADQRVKKLVDQWNKQWLNKAPKSRTLIASEGIRIAGPTSIPTSRPTVDGFRDAWTQDFNAGLEPEMPKASAKPQRQLLQIPANLEWRTGRYGHQKVAVEAFLEAHGRGVLAIATGGGKTRTALIACTLVQQRQAGPMLVVVLVPSRPLMLQWRDAVLEFGVIPLLPSTQKPAERLRQFQELEAALVSGDSRTEVLIATNSLFSGDGFIRHLLDRLPSQVQVVLVGDEMHHLGAPRAFDSLPQRADIRMGLSATPVRQYDPDGTDRLFRYFGEPAFEFGLADAIDAGCLTPYNYYLHEVSMTEIELDKWKELTEELRKAGFVSDDDGRSMVPSPRAERLLRQRRAILEQSSVKVDVLRNLLVGMNPSNIRRCLIYSSAKSPVLEQKRQIERVNEMLSSLGIISHQFTSWETAYDNSGDWLEAFEKGDYQVLTAMKVLDEGIDIPLTDTAFLLASSTVEREWVQRRGRILLGHQARRLRASMRRLWRVQGWRWASDVIEWNDDASIVDDFNWDVGEKLNQACTALTPESLSEDCQHVGFLLRDAWIEFSRFARKDLGTESEGIGKSDVKGVVRALGLPDDTKKTAEHAYNQTNELQHDRGATVNLARSCFSHSTEAMAQIVESRFPTQKDPRLPGMIRPN